jgi:hypothetical protein
MELSVRRQCELLGLNRSSVYYEAAVESEENLALMRLIDEQYTKCQQDDNAKPDAKAKIGPADRFGSLHRFSRDLNHLRRDAGESGPRKPGADPLPDLLDRLEKFIFPQLSHGGCHVRIPREPRRSAWLTRREARAALEVIAGA